MASDLPDKTGLLTLEIGVVRGRTGTAFGLVFLFTFFGALVACWMTSMPATGALLTCPPFVAAGRMRWRLTFGRTAIILEKRVWRWMLSRVVLETDQIQHARVGPSIIGAPLSFVMTDGASVGFIMGDGPSNRALAAWITDRLGNRSGPELAPLPAEVHDLQITVVGRPSTKT